MSSAREKRAPRLDRQRVAEPGVGRAGPLALDPQPIEAAELLSPELGVGPPGGDEAVQARQLVDPERGLQLRRLEVVADVDEQEPRIDFGVAAGQFLAVPQVADPAESAQGARQLAQVVVVGDQHPAFNGGHVVGEEEAEGRQVAETAHPASADGRAVRLAACPR